MIMTEFVFETYGELVDFLSNSNKLDNIILEASKKIIDDPKLELEIVKIRCIEINKCTKIKLTYDDIIDTLHKLLERSIKEEDYESCHEIKTLLDKISVNKK